MKNALKVAMIAPSVAMIHGPDIACLNLTQGLVELGLDVTLFAPADWKVPFKHSVTIEKSLWNIPDFSNKSESFRNSVKNASREMVLAQAEAFDIIHFHLSRSVVTVADQCKKPCVLTMHGEVSSELLERLKAAKVYPVAISSSQRKNYPLPVIWNALPVEDILFSLEPKNFFIFIGRLTHQKGVDRAIAIAQATGKQLFIFGRAGTTPERKKYFSETIEPHLSEQIRYMGLVPHEALLAYMRKAQALLFPIHEPETFGLVAAEALASGTPVIGSRIVPLPEILTDEKCAFLSNDLDELIEAARHPERFDRKACRRYAEAHFDIRQAAEKYLALYKKILKE